MYVYICVCVDTLQSVVIMCFELEIEQIKVHNYHTLLCIFLRCYVTQMDESCHIYE